MFESVKKLKMSGTEKAIIQIALSDGTIKKYHVGGVLLYNILARALERNE